MDATAHIYKAYSYKTTIQMSRGIWSSVCFFL